MLLLIKDGKEDMLIHLGCRNLAFKDAGRVVPHYVLDALAGEKNMFDVKLVGSTAFVDSKKY